MTYPLSYLPPPGPPTPPPARPQRPGTVTVAFVLQMVIVGLLLAVVAGLVAQAVQFDGMIDRAARVTNAEPADVASERTGNIAGTLIIAIPCFLVAALLAACAVPLRRGSNAARILVCIAGGIEVLLCLGPSAIGLLVLPAMLAEPPYPQDPGGDWEQGAPGSGSPAFYDELYGPGSDPYGEWFFLGAGIASLLVFALTVAVVVLVLVPPAGRFFVPRADRPPAVWYPGYAYPPPATYPYPAYPYPSVFVQPGPMPPPAPMPHGAAPEGGSGGLPEDWAPPSGGQPPPPEPPGAPTAPPASGS